jgi:hypothetical protein
VNFRIHPGILWHTVQQVWIDEDQELLGLLKRQTLSSERGITAEGLGDCMNEEIEIVANIFNELEEEMEAVVGEWNLHAGDIVRERIFEGLEPNDDDSILGSLRRNK